MSSAGPLLLCPDPTAVNYANSSHYVEDVVADLIVDAPWVCVHLVPGCADPLADNYRSLETTASSQSSCAYGGCTDPVAKNFNPTATYADGSCEYFVVGCTDPSSAVYSPHFDASCAWARPPPRAPPPPPSSPPSPSCRTVCARATRVD